jgi:sulfide:quinone oxidoreductase
MFLRKEGIDAVTGVSMAGVEGGAVRLSDGRAVPFSWAMVIPPFLGQEVIRSTHGLSDEKGYVTVRDTYQSEKFDDIYAVGVAAAVQVPWTSAVPVGVPKTGFPTGCRRRWRPATSPHRYAARCRRTTRRSVRSRPSASWTPATTA